MREIKFRAWDGERMKEVLTWGFNEGFISTPKICADEQDFEIMQYTGLKDKNGTEIYEGDVVIYHNHKLDIRQHYVVEYENYSGRFCIFNGLNTSYGFNQLDDSVSINGEYQPDIEVIGNIHQNPDGIKKLLQHLAND